MNFDRNATDSDADRVTPPNSTASSENIRYALECAGLGTFDFDAAADTLACDARCRELLGVSSETRLDLRALSECIQADHAERLHALGRRLINASGQGDGVFCEEFRCVTPDGAAERWAAASGHVLFDSQRRPLRVLGTLEDVTGRKLSEQQNERFLNRLGNDLKQSLDELTAAVQGLAEAQPGSQPQPGLERAVAGGLRLSQLVDELREYSRAGRVAKVARRDPAEAASMALYPEVTARLFGAPALKERGPREYASFLEKYSQLLELALDRQTFKLAIAEHSAELRELAERLGAMRAGAREVADLHSEALSQISRGAGRLKAQALVNEGRMLSFELMGYVLSFYRRRARLDSRQPGGETGGTHG